MAGAANRPSIIELLAQPPGIESIDFQAPASTDTDTATSADFD
jgi:hypothetical protein